MIYSLFEGVTRRAFMLGMATSLLMVSINSYLGLKVGLIEEGYNVCVLLAVLFLLLRTAKKRKMLTPHEAVVVGTMGSAGGSLAFMAHFFGALTLAGDPLGLWEMVIFVCVTSAVGLVLSVPMRQLFIVVEELRWPTGRVAISLIEALQKGADSMQPRVLGLFGGLAFLYMILSGGIGWFPEVSFLAAIGLGVYGVGIAWSPFLLGAGYLIGLRVGFGFLVGGVVLWAIGPYIPLDLTPPILPDDHGFHVIRPDRWVWPGVGAVVACGLTGLAIRWRTVINAVKSLKGMAAQGDTDRMFSGKTLIILSIVVFALTATIFTLYFKVSLQYIVVGLVLVGTILTLISTRAAGETAFNPVRVMGIILMVVFFGMGETDKTVLLLAAGLAAGAIGQAGVLTQDIYAGRHFKVRSIQLLALQAIAVLPNALVMALVFDLLTRRYALGTTDGLAAPVSVIWHSVARVLSGEALPPHAGMAMWIGALGGIVVTLLDYWAGKRISFVSACNGLREKALAGEFVEEGRVSDEKIRRACGEAGLLEAHVKGHSVSLWLHGCSIVRRHLDVDDVVPPLRTMWKYFPHSLGITLAMIIPIYFGITFFLGAVFMCYLLPKVLKTDDDTLNSLAAAGIVGEGAGGLVAAVVAVLLG